MNNYVEPFAGSLAVLLGRPHPPKIETVNDLDCYLANFWRALKMDPAGVAEWADSPVNEADLHARHLWLINQEKFRESMKTDPNYFDVKIAGWWVWGISCWIGSGWCEKVISQIPHLFGNGRGVHRSSNNDLFEYMNALSNRLKNIRVTCGDWTRVMGPSVTQCNGICGVFLDPPYSSDRAKCYSVESFSISHDVRQWAIENGDNKLLRIALCGYEGEHDMPGNWVKIEWKTKGGYGSQANKNGKENKHKERIWFSPHCIGRNKQESLF